MIGLLNRVFDRQPAVLLLLSAHSGRSFRLVASPLDATMSIDHDGRLSPVDPAVVPDVTLTIDMKSLWAQGWRPGQPFPERAGLVQVSGDAALAQTLSTLAKSWHPDIEDLLSRFVVDLAAVQLVKGGKRLATLASQFFVRTAQNLAEYAAHEAHWLAADVVLQEQSNELARLNASLDGLQKRLQALDARVRAAGGTSSGDLS